MTFINLLYRCTAVYKLVSLPLAASPRRRPFSRVKVVTASVGVVGANHKRREQARRPGGVHRCSSRPLSARHGLLSCRRVSSVVADRLLCGFGVTCRELAVGERLPRGIKQSSERRLATSRSQRLTDVLLPLCHKFIHLANDKRTYNLINVLILSC